MTKGEFDAWWKHHTAVFPGVTAWLKKFPAESEHEATQREIVAQWFRRLRALELDEAKTASERLYEQEGTKTFGDHPKAILAIARHARYDKPTRPVFLPGGEQSFRCPQCRDEGAIDVWHRQYVQAVLAADETAVPYAAVAACPCEAGDRLRGRVPTYRAEHFCMVNRHNAVANRDGAEEIRQWASQAQGGVSDD